MSKVNKIYLAICICITLALLAFAVFGCFPSLKRLVSAVVDLGTSLAYYFCDFNVVLNGGKNPIRVTVISLPETDVSILFPETFEQFTSTVTKTWEKLFTESNFVGWLNSNNEGMANFSLWIMFLVPLVLIIILITKMLFSGSNNDLDKPTKHLLRWWRMEDVFFKPVKKFVDGYLTYVKQHTIWQKVWKCILLISLNVATIFVEGIAYLLYFVVTFNVVSIYTQVYKLVIDLYLMFTRLPLIMWLLIAWLFMLRWRSNKAINTLRHFEMRNKGFANSLGVCTMLTGNMGVGKTKLMTDLALSLSSNYKHNAKDIMLKVERWFPDFPWATLQDNIRKYMYYHQIYNLTTCEDYVTKKQQRFVVLPTQDKLFGYNYEKFRMAYNNGLQMVSLFQALEDYVKAFFVYYIGKSLILGNYSIREDGIIVDYGNLPMWNYDYFTRAPEDMDEQSYYANILDFDVLRRGKTVVRGSRFADTFEFGIVTITELDKERGNMLDTKELKKLADETNQKNDLFNYSPKMGRHPATIMFKPFVNYLFDQQRPTKTEADLRELCDKLISIEKVHSEGFAQPLFWLEDVIYGIVAPLYHRVYEEYRVNRSDNSLTIYLFKHTLGKFVNWYERQHNLYGFDTYVLYSDSGKMDGKRKRRDRYYLMYKKALANRYSTDCYKEFFRNKSRMKRLGIVDYPTFGNVKATTEELRSMNSYFIRDMDRVFNSDEELDFYD